MPAWCAHDGRTRADVPARVPSPNHTFVSAYAAHMRRTRASTMPSRNACMDIIHSYYALIIKRKKNVTSNELFVQLFIQHNYFISKKKFYADNNDI